MLWEATYSALNGTQGLTHGMAQYHLRHIPAWGWPGSCHQSMTHTMLMVIFLLQGESFKTAMMLPTCIIFFWG